MKTKIFLTVTVILLLLSIVGIATAQNNPQAILRQGSVNSSEIVLSGARDNIYVTVRDTGSTYTDSIYVYAVFKDPYREILLSGVNQDTRSVEQVLVPGTSSTGGWNMPTLGATSIRVVFANQQSVTNRTTWITVVGTSSSLGATDVTATISEPLEIEGSVTANSTDSVITIVDTLDYGDSVIDLSSHFTPGGRFSYALVTLQDTGTVGSANPLTVDSVIAYSVKTNGSLTLYSQVALRNLKTVTDGPVANAGNGVTTYLIYDPIIRDIRFVRSNVSNIQGRRTIVIITLKK